MPHIFLYTYTDFRIFYASFPRSCYICEVFFFSTQKRAGVSRLFVYDIRSIFFHAQMYCGSGKCLRHFQICHVERTYGVAFLHRMCIQIFRIDKRHLFLLFSFANFIDSEYTNTLFLFSIHDLNTICSNHL